MKFSYVFFYAYSLILLWISLSCHRSDEIAREAFANIKQGKNFTALTLFEEALKSNPDNGLALYGKGSLLVQQEVTRHIGRSMLKKAVNHLSDLKSKKEAYFLLAKNSEAEPGIKVLKEMIKKSLMNQKSIYSLLFINLK